MTVQEYLCHGCNSTFAFRYEEATNTYYYVKYPRCNSSDIERYYFPRDACRLHNLVETNVSSSETSLGS